MSLVHTRLITWLCPADPLGHRFPIRVVLGLKLTATGMKRISASLGRERMQQENAALRVTRSDQVRDTSEIEPSLLFRPGCASRRDFQHILGNRGVAGRQPSGGKSHGGR